MMRAQGTWIAILFAILCMAGYDERFAPKLLSPETDGMLNYAEHGAAQLIPTHRKTCRYDELRKLVCYQIPTH